MTETRMFSTSMIEEEAPSSDLPNRGRVVCTCGWRSPSYVLDRRRRGGGFVSPSEDPMFAGIERKHQDRHQREAEGLEVPFYYPVDPLLYRSDNLGRRA